MAIIDVDVRCRQIRTQTLSESGLQNIPAQYVSRAPSISPVADVDGTDSTIYRRRHDHSDSLVPNTIPRGLPVDGVVSMTSAHAEHCNIPVLRLADFEFRREGFLHALRDACRTWGFFQLVDHGVPLTLLQRMQAVQREFFSLPLSVKESYANSPPLRYEGYGSILGDPSDTGRALDWRDYFYATLLPMWQRDTAKWPVHPPHWRTTLEEYYNHIFDLSMKILEALSASLSLPSPNYLTYAFISGCGSQDIKLTRQELEERLDMGFNVNYYPACPQPDLTFGLSHHSDPGGITILLQDDHVPGLQVRSPHVDTKWILVKPHPGAFVINLGDQLEILTNGLYKSVEHRALVNSEHSRISIGCFLNPNNDSIMAPLPHFITKENPSIFNPMSFKDYRSFIRKKGANGKKCLQCINVTPM